MSMSVGERVEVSERQRIATSGARAVERFDVDGLELLAVAQLAVDVPGQAAAMHAGDSDTDLLLLRREGGRFVPWGTLPGPGGEDAEAFAIDGRRFLAIASIRSGPGPYRHTIDSVIHEWVDGAFTAFQRVQGFAAKQWRHWSIDGRHFLGLAQGVERPGLPDENRPSLVLEWDGERFVEHQRIDSRWAYNWHAFAVGATHFVAHAEHLGPSVLYRWDADSDRLQAHQDLVGRAGRAFASFERDGAHHLLVAGLETPPVLLRFDGERFAPVQELEGLGARELEVIEQDGRLFVVRVNFILGTPADPHPVMTSVVYEWRSEALVEVATFPTVGGTDVTVVAREPGETQFAVSNSLTAELRFASQTVVYALTTGDRA